MIAAFDFTFMQRYAQLLQGGFVLAAIIFVTVLALLIALGHLRRKARDRLAARAYFKRTHQPDGTPWPPAGRGMCDKCQKAFERVYQMPDSSRMCPTCYFNAEGFKHQPKKQKD